MKTIAIDIGSQNIKIVEGKGFGQFFKINNLCRITTPLTVYDDGVLFDIETLANHIKSALKDHNMKASYASYIIESSSILSREIDIPAIKKNELLSMIGYEMVQNLPNPVDYYILQFKITDKYITDRLNKLKVLVTAVPKQIVESYIELSKMLDLEPYLLNVKHDSIINLFKKQCEENNKIIFLLLDMGHHYIDAMIYDQCKYKYKRRIDMGGRDINKEIASFYNLSISEAEERKIETSQINLDFREDSSIENITRKNVDQWIEEINKIIQYYTRTNEGQSIHKIWIYGGSSRILNISDYIEKNTGISASYITDISNTNLDKINSKKVKVDEKELYVDYLNAISGFLRNRVIPW